MAFLENHNYSLTPLSPIHLGCDKDYLPFSFVIENNTLYYCEPSAFASSLSASQFKEFSSKALPKTENSLSELQRFAYKNKGVIKLNSSKQVLVTNSVNNDYSTKQQKLSATFNNFIIERSTHNPINDSYIIPGTAIKGAIRTALLNAMAKDNPRDLPYIERTSRDGKKDQKTQEDLLGGKFKTDPLRLIKVGDATSSSDTIGLVGQTVMIKRKQDKGRTIDKNSPSQFVEVLAPGQYKAFSSSITLNNLDVKLIKSGETPSITFSIEDIISACNEFYLPIFEKEFSQLAMLKVLDKAWDTGITNLINGELFRAIKTNKVMLIRIGKHSGAESITIEGARSIKISAPGIKPPIYGDSPTTYWLYTENKKPQNTMPFGWALLSFEGYELPEKVQIKSLCNKFEQQLLQSKKSVEDEIAAITKELEQQRKEDAERAKKKAAEEAAELAKKQALKNMSKEQQAIQNLRDGLENNSYKNAGPGTEFDIQIKQTINIAVEQNWAIELKAELKEVAKSGAVHLGINVKSNKKYKELLRTLN